MPWFLSLGQGGQDDLLGQSADQAIFFRNRDEAIGFDQSAQRMFPAGQHLETDDFAGGQINLRLEIGDELAMLQAVANALLDLAMQDQRPFHSFVEPHRPRGSS